MSDATICEQCKDPTLKGIHTCPEKRPVTASEECARVDAALRDYARLAEKDTCQCEEKCPHCGKKKRQESGARPWPFMPVPMPYYPAQPQNPAPPFYPGSPPGQYPGVWCGMPPTP